MKTPLLFVEWYDAHSVDSWSELEQIPDVPMIYSVGFMVRETKLSITLAPTIDSDLTTMACTIVIPKGMIKRKIKIKAK